MADITLTQPCGRSRGQASQLAGLSFIDGTYCQYADEVKAGDVVAANLDSRTVHTGGGLYLLERRDGDCITWSGCRRMILTPAGIDMDQTGNGAWVTFPDIDATGWHIVGAIETVYRPTR